MCIIHTVQTGLVGKLTTAFLRGQSWWLIKPWYTSGDPEQEFHCFYPEELKGAVSWNSAKLGNYKMPVKLGEHKNNGLKL